MAYACYFLKSQTAPSIMILARIALILMSFLLVACHNQLTPQEIQGPRSSAKAGEFLQTDVDRIATLAMRDNLNSLYLLMHKLYQRNPHEWAKAGQPNAEAAEQAVQQAIYTNQPLPALDGRRDIKALSHVLSEHFSGDRVGPLIYALASMLITAHGGRTEFFLTDSLQPLYINNAARDIERAVWLLKQRKDPTGQPLLLMDEGSNLSFSEEFAKITARLDLLVQVLDERYRRVGVNYVHSLLFINFLPIQ